MQTIDVYGDEARPEAVIDHHPDRCPLCHRGLAIGGLYFMRASEEWVQGAYQCPDLKCHHLFIAAFELSRSSGYYFFKYAVPFEPIPRVVNETLRQVSAEFAETYKQAWRAKDERLDKIAGTGFRRALEFLVKDYASRNETPENVEAIKKKPLVQCIKEHIKEDGIRTVAERAAWLGNDETHYLRKWEGKDVDDLIDLIDSVGDWIVIHIKTERLKTTMQPKK